MKRIVNMLIRFIVYRVIGKFITQKMNDRQRKNK
ncbi:Uncharacterised protein [Staphylococcus pseudintermedius]|nr:Uncharacterised protein [Staphylococcus pseudintermedius]VTS32923.1 Uncharacterised protein [Staphylococcus pseudintermedius]